MTQMLVGYRLIEIATETEIQSWGGTWGQCAGEPNPLFIPTGMSVCAPKINEAYDGYKLVEWLMDEPATVPESITPRQVRLLLLQQGLLDQVEAMIAAQDRATQITWQFASVFLRDNPLLVALAANLGLTTAQIDGFFTDAAAL